MSKIKILTTLLLFTSYLFYGNLNAQVNSDYEWANNIVNQGDCSSTDKIERYNSGSLEFVLIYKDAQNTLYLADGTQYCQSSLTLDCKTVYGLSNPGKVWTCGAFSGTLNIAFEEYNGETIKVCPGTTLEINYNTQSGNSGNCSANPQLPFSGVVTEDITIEGSVIYFCTYYPQYCPPGAICEPTFSSFTNTFTINVVVESCEDMTSPNCIPVWVNGSNTYEYIDNILYLNGNVYWTGTSYNQVVDWMTTNQSNAAYNGCDYNNGEENTDCNLIGTVVSEVCTDNNTPYWFIVLPDNTKLDIYLQGVDESILVDGRVVQFSFQEDLSLDVCSNADKAGYVNCLDIYFIEEEGCEVLESWQTMVAESLGSGCVKVTQYDRITDSSNIEYFIFYDGSEANLYYSYKNDSNGYFLRKYGRIRRAISTWGLSNPVVLCDCPSYRLSNNSEKMYEDIIVSPNPATDFISIIGSTPLKEKFPVTIMDVRGKVIKTIDLNINERIDISELEKGLYFIRINAKNWNTRTMKFIKI